MAHDTGMPACPVCGSGGQVYKLSQVYVAGITETGDRSPADEELLSAVFGRTGSPSALSDLLRSFAPPAEPYRNLPLIHPDLLMLGAFILAVAIVYSLFARRSGWFWPPAAAGGGLSAAYLAARGAIIRRYRIARQAVAEGKKVAGQSAGRWLKVYYCARDACVFDPEQGDHTALAEAQAFLLR